MDRASEAVADTPGEDRPLSPDLEAEIDRALAEAKDAEVMPAVTQVQYLSRIHVVSLRINNGQRLLIPAEDMQFVSAAEPEQLREAEIIGYGTGIGFPAIDAHFSTEGLLAGRYGNKKWMEQLEARRAAALEAAA